MLDTTGSAKVIRQAVDSLAPKGTCGVLGASAPGSEIVLDEVQFMSHGRRLMGIVEGDSTPDTFIPMLIEELIHGSLALRKGQKVSARNSGHVDLTISRPSTTASITFRRSSSRMLMLMIPLLLLTTMDSRERVTSCPA
ncbi:hypothetical protein [Paraburkholderia guartelaensis]|uniref:hypothetical protein n=1 Tax=Paraburkholderia guartelaensis TaxID=2546446 RepID=UPI002AB76DF0|nr:hypothetical protein [Paraburkholderia guartelaensis]